MKKENCLMMYTIGVVLLFIAGINLLYLNIGSPLIQFILHLGIGIGLLGISCVSYEEDTFKEISKLPFLLSLISFFITYLFIGGNGLLGTAFSFEGTLSSYFVASIWLVLALLSSLMFFRYKEYWFLSITIIGFLLFITNIMKICIHSNYLVLLIITLLAGILRFIKIPTLQKIGKYTSVGLLLFTCLFFQEEEQALYLFLLSLAHFFHLLVGLKQDNSFECEVLSIILALVYFLTLYAQSVIDRQLLLVLMVVGIAFIEIGVNCFSLLQNKGLKKTSKCLCTIGYLFTLYQVEDIRTFLALFVLIAMTSIINMFIFYHDEDEKNIVWIKGLFVILMGLKFFSLTFVQSYLPLVLLDFLALLLLTFHKRKWVKKEMGFMTVVLSILLVLQDFSSLQFIVTSLVLLINYFVLTSSFEWKEKKNTLYYGITLIFFLLLLWAFPETIAYLVVTSILLLLCFYHRETHTRVMLTIPLIIYALTHYIGIVLALEELTPVANYALLYCLGAYISLKVIKTSQMVWLNIFFVILSLFCMDIESIFASILVCLASIGLLVLSKNKGSSKIIGLFFLILGMINLLEYMNELGAFLLLLVIGLSLLFRVFKTFNKEDTGKAKEMPFIEKPKRKNHFCGYCGKPVHEGDHFCGNCGHKIEEV